MPKVGRKKFSYSKKGRKAAKAYAKKTGMPMMTPTQMKKKMGKKGKH